MYQNQIRETIIENQLPLELLSIISRFSQHCIALSHLTKVYFEHPVVRAYPSERKRKALCVLERAFHLVESGSRFSALDPVNPNISKKGDNTPVTGISFDDIYRSMHLREPQMKDRFDKKSLKLFKRAKMNVLESAFEGLLQEIYDSIRAEVGHMGEYPVWRHPYNNDIETLPFHLNSVNSFLFVETLTGEADNIRLGRLQESLGNRETWPYGAMDHNNVRPINVAANMMVDDAGVGLDNNNGNDDGGNALGDDENEARIDNDNGSNGWDNALEVDENVARDEQNNNGHINHNDAWQGAGENVDGEEEIIEEQEIIEEHRNNEEDDNIAVVSDDEE